MLLFALILSHIARKYKENLRAMGNGYLIYDNKVA